MHLNYYMINTQYLNSLKILFSFYQEGMIVCTVVIAAAVVAAAVVAIGAGVFV